MKVKPRGRKRKFAEYDELLDSLPKVMKKRPKYVNGIGVFRGARGDTAWLKIALPNGGVYGGKTYPKGSSVEIKVGQLLSWSWGQLEDRRRELQGRADRGEALEDEEDILFSDWAEDWLERSRSRVKGFGILKGHLNKHVFPVLGKKTLTRISVADINRWQSKQLQTLEPGTVKRQYNTLRACLNDAVRSGHIDKNPCVGADKIKGIKARQRFLTTEEMLKLLEAAESEAAWFADLLLWFLHSGMRKNEALGLRWIHIRELPTGAVIAELSDTKSGQGRHVVCTATMKEVIERQKARMKQGDDRVWPYASITIRRKWEKVRKAVGLEDVVMHDLRRTHATHAVAAGVDLRTLAGRIGHTDLTMLQKHYAALVGSAAEEAAEKIENILAVKD